MKIPFYYNNVRNYFESAGHNLNRLWNDVRTWPKEKIVCLLTQVEKNRRKAWGSFFCVRNILASDRKDMLNMYYLFTNTEQRRKQNLRIDNRFMLNILEKIGLRATNEDDEYGCCICSQDMEDVDRVSLINCCGHCMHTHCLDDRLSESDNDENKCPICEIVYTKYDIYSIFGDQRNKKSFFQKISDYFKY